MLANPDQIWIVMPVYNESQTLPRLIADIRKNGMKCVVIDDGSSDGSEATAAAADTVIRHPTNRGYEAALMSGFGFLQKTAGWRWAVTIDSDGQFAVDDVVGLIAAADAAGADVLVGARPALRRLSERFAALSLRPFLQIRDPFCGVKGFRSEVLTKFPGSGGRTINLELLARAKMNGYAVVERPIAVSERKFSVSRFGGLRGELRLLNAFFSVFMLCLRARLA